MSDQLTPTTERDPITEAGRTLHHRLTQYYTRNREVLSEILAIEAEAAMEAAAQTAAAVEALRELAPFAAEIEHEYSKGRTFDYHAVKGFIGWVVDHRELLNAEGQK